MGEGGKLINFAEAKAARRPNEDFFDTQEAHKIYNLCSTEEADGLVIESPGEGKLKRVGAKLVRFLENLGSVTYTSTARSDQVALGQDWEAVGDAFDAVIGHKRRIK